MAKYLFFILFLNYALAENPISPRYIIIKKTNGLFEYHKINDYRVTDSGSQKDDSKRVFLFSENYCLTINNYSLKESFKVTDSFKDDYDAFAFVLDESKIKSEQGISCNHKTNYDSLIKRNGLSRQLNDYILDHGQPTQKELQDLVLAYSTPDKATPYPEVCAEVKNLKKIVNYLVKNGYYKVSKRDKTVSFLLPMPGSLTPTFKPINYELHKDKVINFIDSETNLSLTSKADDIINKSREIIQLNNIAKEQPLMDFLNINLKDKLGIIDQNLSTYNAEPKSIPPIAFLAAPLNKEQYLKYLKYLKSGGRFVKAAAFEIVLAESALALFLSGSNLNVKNPLAIFPANIISTLSIEEEKEACRRIIHDPNSLRAVHDLLEVTTNHFLYLDDLDTFVQDYDSKSYKVINQDRTNHKILAPVLSPQSKSNAINQ